MWAENEAQEKENERRKAERKEKARAKKAAQEEEKDPAAKDVIGHEEAADIPVLSQSWNEEEKNIIW